MKLLVESSPKVSQLIVEETEYIEFYLHFLSILPLSLVALIIRSLHVIVHNLLVE